MKKFFSCLSLVVFLVATTSTAAFAHAQLVSTSPANEQHVTTSPSEVSLTFEESVGTQLGSLQLFRENGSRINVSEIQHSDGGKTISVKPNHLSSGIYVVNWHVISQDTHPVHGAFLFSVGNTGSAQTARSLETKLAKSDRAPYSARLVLSLLRFAIFICNSFVIGYLILWLIGFSPARQIAQKRLNLAIGIGIIASLVSLQAQGAVSNAQSIFSLSSSSTLHAVLFSNFGKAVCIRIFGLLAAIFATKVNLVRKVTAVIAVIAITYSFSFASHAINGRWYPTSLIFDLLHVLAVSIWFGGLILLLFYRNNQRIEEQLKRFSPIALYCVILIVCSGLFASLRQVGSISALLHTSYGNWLIFKIILFMIVITVAWFTRQRALNSGALRTVMKYIVAEIVLIISIFAATTLLTEQIPARQALVQAISRNVSSPDGNLIFNVVIDPAKAGPINLHIYLLNKTGQTQDAQSVTAQITNNSRNIGPLDIPLVKISGNHYLASNTQIPFPGKWRLTMHALLSEIDEEDTETTLLIR